MIIIPPPKGAREGRFRLVAASSTVAAEWQQFVARALKDAVRAYERLSTEPLIARGTRQFPLKGRALKPFWEYELDASDRLYYAVDLQNNTVVVSVGKHPASSRAAAKRILARRQGFDKTVQLQRSKESMAKPAKTPVKH